MTELSGPLPCPFCGGENIRIVHGGSWCLCEECGCEGPDKQGGDPVINWNRRAPQGAVLQESKVLWDEHERLHAEIDRLKSILDAQL